MDKREAVRVPVRVRARCRHDGVVIDGFVEDLSRSGLFLRADAATIDPGEAAALDLEVPGEHPLRIDAQVVRVDHRTGREGLAFRFLDQQATRRTLANFIMRQHQSGQ